MSETREYASLMKINGTEIPPPSNLGPLLYKTYDSESAGRSETFVMTRDVVRRNVRKFTLTWKLKTPDMRTLLELLEADAVTITLFDLKQDADTKYSDIEVYPEPSQSVECLFWDPYDTEESWWQLTVAFTEY